MVRVLEADLKRHVRSLDDRRALNHHLAELVFYAFHAPEKMPPFEASGAERGRKPEARMATDAEITRAVGFFMSLAAAP